jgi:hypothetical protein
MSVVEQKLLSRIKKQPKLSIPPRWLNNTGEVEAFVAGVAAAATMLYGHPITANDVSKCITGITKAEGYIGGVEKVLGSLASNYVLKPVECDGLPTVYYATRKVSIGMFARDSCWFKNNFGDSPRILKDVPND